MPQTWDWFGAQRQDLEQLRRAGGLRSLAPRAGTDFASNDYLALAGSAELELAAVEALERGVPVGAGGSRLLRGNHSEHERLEAEAARLFGSEASLFFATGFAANSALLSTLPQRGDCILFDELAHASMREGLRLSRAASLPVRHNDLQQMESLASEWRARHASGTLWIAVESLYSMDGDLAPLDDLVAIAHCHGAILIIDEAHATGVLGVDGLGLARPLQHHEHVITVRTCGKALGCEGALICGSQTVVDFLVNRGRGFIFSTAPSPLMAALVREALRLLQMQPARRDALGQRVRQAHQLLGRLAGHPLQSQIVPIVIGEPAETMRLAMALQVRGFDVRGIRPPTVPDGTSRLRISITLNAGEEDVEALARALHEVMPGGGGR